MAGPGSDDRKPDTQTYEAGEPEATPIEIPSARRGEPPEVYALPPRFQVKRLLARGGMGVVLEVHDATMDRDVAVKILPRERRGDRDLRARFLREARAAGVLHHPAIVTVHDIDPDGGFIVMELVSGESLQELLKRERRLPPAEVRRIGRALLQALGAAHAAGIIHRDVKPGNILIDADGVVKLADFGIASFDDSDLTSTGTRIGTPAYMAPEQLRGRVADVRADLYAAGATLYEAATGERLHQAEGPIEDPAARIHDACGDDALALAISRAVRERPIDRFATAAEMESALALLAPPAPPAMTTNDIATAPILRVAPPRRSTRAIIAVLAIAVALGAAAIALSFARARVLLGVAFRLSAAANEPQIALLPFVDRTADPRLDFASSGLPHLLGGELHRAPGLGVIGYYQLFDRVTQPATPEGWRAAARSLGATDLVEGSLDRTASGYVVTVVVREAQSGAERGRFTAQADQVDQIPDRVRKLAAAIAGAALGRPTEIREIDHPDFEAERALQLGIAALERHDFVNAEDLLRQAIRLAPQLAEAHYHLAILTWWISRPADETRREIDLAKLGALDPAQHGFLEGLELLSGLDYPGATAYFRKLAAQFPGERDIEYGLMESLFHGGDPAAAMVVYRRVAELSPRFSLGVIHPLMYYLSHGDGDGAAWALTRLRGDDEESAIWGERLSVMRRDVPHAIDALQRWSDSHPSATVDRELAVLYALNGQLGLGESTERRLDEDQPHSEDQLLIGFAIATGARAAEERLWTSQLDLALKFAAGAPRMQNRVNLAVLALGHVDRARLAQVVAGLEADAPPVGQVLPVDVARALIYGELGDAARIAAARKSIYPEVAAIADAYTTTDPATVAAALRRAIAASNDGRLMGAEWYVLARTLARVDDAGAIAACDEVIRPRLFTWTWAGTVGPCEQITAEAATRLGRPEVARAAWQRLLARRIHAEPGDPLVAAARSALGQ